MISYSGEKFLLERQHLDVIKYFKSFSIVPRARIIAEELFDLPEIQVAIDRS